MQSLQHKRFLVFGVASDTSLAWAVARELGAQGASVTIGYQRRFRSRVLQLVKDQPWIEQHEECDVSSEESVTDFYGRLTGEYDGIVHSVAFAPAEALGAPIIETTEADFTTAMVISAYSLVRVTRLGLGRLRHGAAVVTLSYLGSDRVIPGYRVMGTAKAALESLVRELAASVGPAHGIRVNAVSAGPVRTLAASGIPDFDLILDWMANNTPLRRNVTHEEVASTMRFLLGTDSSGITGQTIYVDAGYVTVGAPLELDRVLIEPRLEPVESVV